MDSPSQKVFKFTQTGTLSIIIMLPILVFSLVMFFISLRTDLFQVVLFSFLAATFLLCLLIFYKLTITIDNENVAFRMGTGIISKTYPLSEIRGCKPVRNSPLAGVGIKLLPNGWLYNVSGQYAIELSFKNSKSVVRIGTNKPDEVSELINTLISSERIESIPSKKEVTGYVISGVIIFLALFLPAVLIITGGKEQSVEFGENGMTISGIYGMTINYSGITIVDTVSYLPAIRRRTNGYAAGNTLKGNFTVNNGTRVKLFVKKANPPYIHIESGGLILYLNFRDRKKTKDIYSELRKKTGFQQ